MIEQSAAGTVLEGLDGQPLPPGEAPLLRVDFWIGVEEDHEADQERDRQDGYAEVLNSGIA